MKTSEFIKHLQALDPDAEVLIMNYDGDSWDYVTAAVPVSVKTNTDNSVLLTAAEPEQP